MKKKGAALVSVLFAGVLAGCSFGADSSSESSEDATTIEIFQGKVEFNDQFEELAEKYEEENPEVDIKITSVGGGSDYAGSLKTKFASGDEPEIFSIAGPTEAANYEEYLADLSDTELADLALEGTLNPVTKDGELHGLPFNQEGYGLIYNKDMFKEAGIDPSEILTYEDLEKAVQTLDSQKDELGIEAVFAFPAKEKWVPGNHLSNVYLAPEFNHMVMEAYKAEGVQFERNKEFKRMIDLQNDYSIQPTLSLDYSQQVEQYFSLQEVAIIQQGNWVYPSVEQMDSDFAKEGMGILPIPVDGEEGKLPVGVPNYWAVNNNSDDETIQAAKDFLDWMYTSDVGKDYVLNEFKFIPAYEGYNTDEISDPLSKEIYQYASEDQTTGWVFLGYPGTWGDYVGSNVQKYIDGEMTWDELVEDSKQEWTRMDQ
ncbi:carbohydrate ABC transporter substrate-binding protein [Halobacillus trueperi]|uniref:Carbohydrate ABC transporter substrate-binding protein n=1 Tax=Halobacillus trueperi TaxID=156205 RepID=A0A3D8VLZ8_9BACI|nr:ABC transporter substrate-binding protein [Halobacillus trueperi]RDY70449.1 carbohydrate ABC transporter substrate-binding protein [Halobacillus trueperi]